ncbi:MAG TPA: hypothetical protein VF190_03305 [Rhodothermales bacterium]
MPRSSLAAHFIVAVFVFGGLRAHAQTPPPEAPSALLLGLRFEEAIPAPLPYYAGSADSLARARYRTFLFVQEPGGTLELRAELPGVVVPRRTGLWLVDARRSLYNNWVEDFLTAAPFGVKPDRPGIQPYNGEFCKGHRVQIVHFAAPSYLGLEQQSAGYCEDAAHPWFTNALAIVPVDSTLHLGLRISDVLGRNGEAALAAGIDRFLAGLQSQQERALYSGRQDEANWGLIRRNGHWLIRARVESDELATARFADFVLPMRPPASLVGFDELAPSWERIREFVPDATDAVSSPQKDWVVILRPGRLSVHPVLRDTSIGPAASEFPVPRGAVIVLNQWTNQNARTWSQLLRGQAPQASVGWQPVTR